VVNRCLRQRMIAMLTMWWQVQGLQLPDHEYPRAHPLRPRLSLRR
jgi:hypothetical protein